ncbi:hypothetical protein [Streptomyces sp. F001]|uniref:hypothetical protein n=1 Tax=Streptomyces sp. F001 TaxID=1510026 RepID=UPI001F1086B7|nr:hypothetical protein [Streptomyces sp. F001]
MLPDEVHGKPALILVVVHTGEPATADEVVESLAALGQPLANLVTKTTWVQANSMLDAVAPTACA